MKISGNSLAAAVIGFAISFLCCLPFILRKTDPPAVEEQERTSLRTIPSTTPRPALTSASLRTQLSSGALEDPNTLLVLASRADTLSREEREAALAMLLERPEDERRQALAILLLRWLETDPEQAMLWCHEELKRAERESILYDLSVTWAHRDGHALARWWEATMPDKELRGMGERGIFKILSRLDPLAYAAYMELPRMHSTSSSGGIEEAALPPADELPRYAEAILGNVGYDPANRDELILQSTDRHLTGKSGWNDLFEKVAVAWHRESPEACETWLRQFSEEAQIAARHRIENAN